MSDDNVIELVGRWRQDAETRKRRVPSDPVAATLEVCAAELEEQVIRAAARPLTPEEYAVKAGVTPQTVTAWCRNGTLEAYQDGRQWRIPPHAERAA